MTSGYRRPSISRQHTSCDETLAVWTRSEMESWNACWILPNDRGNGQIL